MRENISVTIYCDKRSGVTGPCVGKVTLLFEMTPNIWLDIDEGLEGRGWDVSNGDICPQCKEKSDD